MMSSFSTPQMCHDPVIIILAVIIYLPSSHCCPWCHNGLLHGFRSRALGAGADEPWERSPWLGQRPDSLADTATGCTRWLTKWRTRSWNIHKNLVKVVKERYTHLTGNISDCIVLHEQLSNSLLFHLNLVDVRLFRQSPRFQKPGSLCNKLFTLMV